MNKWDQQRITAWAVSTFGDIEDVTDVLDRGYIEYDELLDTAYDAKQGLCNYDDVAGELADVTIFLMQAAEHYGFNLLEEVDKKMEINYGRKWRNTGVGIGRHV